MPPPDSRGLSPRRAGRAADLSASGTPTRQETPTSHIIRASSQGPYIIARIRTSRSHIGRASSQGPYIIALWCTQANPRLRVSAAFGRVNDLVLAPSHGPAIALHLAHGVLPVRDGAKAHRRVGRAAAQGVSASVQHYCNALREILSESNGQRQETPRSHIGRAAFSGQCGIARIRTSRSHIGRAASQGRIS
eukprot:SAG11_NODE_2870_length_2882_cov_8.871362_2_plen_192_part_00